MVKSSPEYNTGFRLWYGKWSGSRNNRSGWGCWIQALQGPSGIAFKPLVSPDYFHEKYGKGHRSSSNLVCFALWHLRYIAANCYSSQSWGHEWAFCLGKLSKTCWSCSYTASKGNHQHKTCLKREIENSLGRKCVYTWHDIYLLSCAIEPLPKLSWKLNENGFFLSFTRI